MPLGRHYLTLRDSDGNALEGASVTVRDFATEALRDLFADIDGAEPLDNPVLSDADGRVTFFTEYGKVNLICSAPGRARTLRGVVVSGANITVATPGSLAGLYIGSSYPPMVALQHPDYDVELPSMSLDGEFVSIWEQEAVNGMAFSPDGTQLLVAMSGYNDESFAVFDTTTWETVPGLPFATSYSAYAAAWSADGSMAAVVQGDRMYLMDTSDWSEIALDGNAPGSGSFFGCSFSPDGSILAAITSSNNPSVRPLLLLWDTATGDVIPGPDTADQPGPFAGNQLAFSLDGSKLYFPGVDGVSIYDTTTWERIDLIEIAAGVSAVAISPNGLWMAVCLWDYPGLIIYDLSDMSEIEFSTIDGDPPYGYALAFSPDSARLAYAADFWEKPDSSYRQFAVWQTSDWTMLPDPPTAALTTAAYGVDFSPNNGAWCIAWHPTVED